MAIETKLGTAQSVSSGSSWTTPENILADEATEAYAVTAGSRNANWDIIVSGFGFNIPSNSTINSITLETVYKLSTTSSAGTISMFAQYDGAARGTGWSSTAEPLTDTPATTTDVGALTIAELNSSLFQVVARVRRTSNTACNYSFAYIKVTVDWSAGSTGFMQFFL